MSTSTRSLWLLMYGWTFWTVIVCIGAEAIIIYCLHMHTCTQSINFPSISAFRNRESWNASIFFKPHQETLRRLRTSRRVAATLSCKRLGLVFVLIRSFCSPFCSHCRGRGGEAGGWQLAFKNANPTTLKGPDNSWGPHQFVYSSVIRSRHLDCAPAEHRQPCRVERGARCDRGPGRSE